MVSWYFETSGFNYFLKSVNFEAFLNTRELQNIKGNKLYISPITLWEIMLTSDDSSSDFLIFSAQNMFCDRLLATPSELLIRYLQNAYPKNKVKYNIYTGLEMGNIWSKMTTNNSVNFNYDKSQLKQKTSIIRNISKNLPLIINGSVNHNDKYLFNISNVIGVYYECSLEDGFLPSLSNYDTKVLFKLVILFTLLFFIMRMDIFSSIIEDFWKNTGIEINHPTEMLIYIFEKYPDLFKRGPLLEMATMAYNQVKSGKTNRGLIFDCYHMIYAPYVNWIVTADDGFNNLKKLESHYSNKIIRVSEMNIGISPYIGK